MYKGSVGSTRLYGSRSEVPKNEIDIQGARCLPPEQRSVSRQSAVLELVEADHACAHRVEVDVSEKREKIRLFFDEHRFEAVLEKVPATVVGQIERDGVTG